MLIYLDIEKKPSLQGLSVRQALLRVCCTGSTIVFIVQHSIANNMSQG